MKYTAEEIEQILKDYRWMLNTVQTMREELKETDGAAIAQYGIESVMSKGKGDTGDVVYGEVVRRSKQWERIETYEERIRFVQENMHKVQEPRQAEVLYWLLEGKSNKAISNHVGLSYSHTRRIIAEIPKVLMQYEHFGQLLLRCLIFFYTRRQVVVAKEQRVNHLPFYTLFDRVFTPLGTWCLGLLCKELRHLVLKINKTTTKI